MRDTLLALLYLAAGGFLPATALTGSVTLGIFCSVPVVLVVSSLCASVATFASLSATSLLLVVLGLVNGVAIWRLVRDRRAVRSARSLGRPGVVVWLTAFPLVLLLVRPSVPGSWDVRSIWWFHASWFLHGGDVVREALANSLVEFSQTDYPTGNPMAIAGLWQLRGGRVDFWQAQALSAAMTALALGLLGLVLVQRGRAAGVVAATLAVAAASDFGSGTAAGGYLDVLCAALLVVSALAPFLLSDQRGATAVFALCLAAAASTKKEGVAFGLVVVAVVLVFQPHGRRKVLAWGALALVPALLWRLVLESTGSPVHEDVSVGGIARLFEPESLRRLGKAVPAVFQETSSVLVPAVVACVVAALAIRARRRQTGVGSFGDLVPAAVCCVAAVATAVLLSVVYAVNELPLAWWLWTSVDRATATPRLFAVAAMCATVPVVLGLTRAEPVGERSEDPDAPCHAAGVAPDPS